MIEGIPPEMADKLRNQEPPRTLAEARALLDACRPSSDASLDEWRDFYKLALVVCAGVGLREHEDVPGVMSTDAALPGLDPRTAARFRAERRPRTLTEAKALLDRYRPEPDAPVTTWRDFQKVATVIYARVATTDEDGAAEALESAVTAAEDALDLVTILGEEHTLLP